LSDRLFNLTPGERRVVVFLALLLVFGGVLRLVGLSVERVGTLTDRGLEQTRTVNINTATKAELEQLPFIGPKTAAAIIIYRREHGHFKTIDDLKGVKGIGDKKLKALKKHIVLK